MSVYKDSEGARKRNDEAEKDQSAENLEVTSTKGKVLSYYKEISPGWKAQQ